MRLITTGYRLAVDAPEPTMVTGITEAEVGVASVAPTAAGALQIDPQREWAWAPEGVPRPQVNCGLIRCTHVASLTKLP